MPTNIHINRNIINHKSMSSSQLAHHTILITITIKINREYSIRIKCGGKHKQGKQDNDKQDNDK
jgi:hypothetical protein